MGPRSLVLLAGLLLLAPALALPAVAGHGDGAAAPAHGLTASFVHGSFADATRGLGFEGELIAFHERESKAFTHVRYHQVIDALPVYGASASHHAAKANTALRFSHLNLVDGHARGGEYAFDEAQALALARAHIGTHAFLPHTTAVAERMWYPLPESGELRKAYVVTLPLLEPAGEWRIILDGASGAILDARNVSLSEDDSAPRYTTHTAAAPQGSARVDVPARVFKVNPIVALEDGELRDNPLSIDDARFNDAWVDVTLEGIHEGMPFMNDDIWIVDTATIGNGVLDAKYRRDDPRFVEVMLLHFTTIALEELAAQGYEDFMPYQVRGLSRVPSPMPNAMATTIASNGYVLFFWRAPVTEDGFSSSAEDGEVVVHELGHLLHTIAAPGVSGAWRGAWAEGSADFFAAILLESEEWSGGFGDPCITEWFAQYLGDGMPTWEGMRCLRNLENELVYPDDMAGTPERPGSGHFNGQFWSGPNWLISRDVGRNASIELFVEALHLTPADLADVSDFATMLLMADCGLNGCASERIIRGAFATKNIEAPDLPAHLLPEIDLAEQDHEPVEHATPGPAMVLVGLGILGVALASRRRRD